MAKKGIDVSKHNGVIDWGKVKAFGVDFAMLRACFGWDNDSQIDPQFHANAKGCQAAGIPFGIYHYSYAHTAAEAVKEAKFFLRVIDGLRPDYPVAFDFEEASQVGGRDSKGKLHQGLAPSVQLEVIDAFMRTVEKAGYYAVLYSSASALERLRKFAPDRLAKYDVWVAHITAQKPGYGGKYGIWQYSWTGRIAGIKGDVDMNYGYRDYPAIIRATGLNGFAKPDAPEETPPELPGDEPDVPSESESDTVSRAEYDELMWRYTAMVEGVKALLERCAG